MRISVLSLYVFSFVLFVPFVDSSSFCMLLIHTALQFSIWAIEVNGVDSNRKKYNAMTIVEK
jgi:hypothetical protein